MHSEASLILPVHLPHIAIDVPLSPTRFKWGLSTPSPYARRLSMSGGRLTPITSDTHLRRHMKVTPNS